MSASVAKLPAVLVLGPTGVGKTPLGECLERLGLWGRRCVHLDFGAQLRRVAVEGGGGDGLSPADEAVVHAVLSGSALLEDHQFPIAAALLAAFVRRRQVGPGDLLVLNGLPRHVGQATAVAAWVRVAAVVKLEADAATLHARIAGNLGGDRAGRQDDALEAVRRKLSVYAARTEPLAAHYARKGVSIRRLSVSVTTRPETLREALELDPPHWTGE